MPDPTITVGLPVRNGAELLPRAVASVLGQTFSDLELVIVDNASTDDTPRLAAEAGRADPRVRFIQQERDVGAVANFNTALALARGEYFCWLAHDDWFDPSYLETCLAELRADPGLIHCSTHMGVVDRSSTVFRVQHEALEGLAGPDPRRRHHRMLWSLRDPTAPVFGLMRTAAIREVGGIPAVPQPDRQLLQALALHGRLRARPEVLFFHYGPPGHTAHYGAGALRRRSWDWIHAPGTHKVKASPARVLAHRLVIVWRSGMSVPDKTLSSGDVLVATAFLRTRSKAKLILRRR